PENCKQLGFKLHEGGYDARLPYGGWDYRRERVGFERTYREQLEQQRELDSHNQSETNLPVDPFRARKPGQGIGSDKSASSASGLAATATGVEDDPNAPGPAPPVHPPDLAQLELATAAETLARTGQPAEDEGGRVMDEMTEQSTGIILG